MHKQLHTSLVVALAVVSLTACNDSGSAGGGGNGICSGTATIC